MFRLEFDPPLNGSELEAAGSICKTLGVTFNRVVSLEVQDNSHTVGGGPTMNLTLSIDLTKEQRSKVLGALSELCAKQS